MKQIFIYWTLSFVSIATVLFFYAHVALLPILLAGIATLGIALLKASLKK